MNRYKEEDIYKIYAYASSKYKNNLIMLNKYKEKYPLFGDYATITQIYKTKIIKPDTFETYGDYLHNLFTKKEYNNEFKVLVLKYIWEQIANIKRRKVHDPNVEKYQLADVARIYDIALKTIRKGDLANLRERYPLHPDFNNFKLMRRYAENLIVPDEFKGSRSKERYRDHLWNKFQSEDGKNVNKDFVALVYSYVCNKFTTIDKRDLKNESLHKQNIIQKIEGSPYLNVVKYPGVISNGRYYNPYVTFQYNNKDYVAMRITYFTDEIVALFDLRKLNLVKKIVWSVNSGSFLTGKQNGKCVYMHQIIMNSEPNAEKSSPIKHLNSIGYDNRLENLQYAVHRHNNTKIDQDYLSKSFADIMVWAKKIF